MQRLAQRLQALRTTPLFTWLTAHWAVVAMASVGIVAAVTVFMAARRGAVDPTTGVILVDTPQIYTRERLVNDRFREDSWLKERLNETGRESSFSLQAVQNTRHDEDISLGLRLSSTGPLLPSPASPNVAGGGASPGATAAATPTAQANPLRFSPIDEFRDFVAYREEVRSAILETQLDDRHDIRGNTLYRLKFDSTVVPQQATSAWAVVYVELSEMTPPDLMESADIYRKWLEHYEAVLNDSAEAMARAFKSVTMQPEHINKVRYYAHTSLARRFPEAQLISILDRLQNGRAERLDRYAKTIRGGIAKAQPKGPAGPLLLPPPPCEQYFGPQATPDCFIHEELLDLLIAEAKLGNERVPFEVLVRTIFFKFVADDQETKIGENKVTFGMLANSKIVGCRERGCRIKLEETEAGRQEFARLLAGNQVYAYTVTPKESVQRLSSVLSSRVARSLRASLGAKVANSEQMASFSDVREELQQAMLRRPLVVGLPDQGPNGKQSDVARFGWLIGPRVDVDNGKMIFRHAPTQTSLSAIISVPSWWRKVGVKTVTCWVSERGIVEHLRVGAGLLEPFVGIKECREKLDDKGPGRTLQYAVRLPSSPSEISRQLGLDVERRPRVNVRPASLIRIGQDDVRILIEGGHLWRSTVVTLGALEADEISVLPNMGGIIARFKKIHEPTEWMPGNPCLHLEAEQAPTTLGPLKRPQEIAKAVELRVWTSEGQSTAGFACVLPKGDTTVASKSP